MARGETLVGRSDGFIGVPNDGDVSFAFRISFPTQTGQGDLILFLPNLSHLQPEKGDEVLVAFEHGGAAGVDGLSNTISFGEYRSGIFDPW